MGLGLKQAELPGPRTITARARDADFQQGGQKRAGACNSRNSSAVIF